MSSLRIYLKCWPLGDEFACDQIEEYRKNSKLYFTRHNINMMFTVHAFDCAHNIQSEILNSIHKYNEPGFHGGRAFADMYQNLNIEEENVKDTSNKGNENLLINENEPYLQGKTEEKIPLKQPLLEKNLLND